MGFEPPKVSPERDVIIDVEMLLRKEEDQVLHQQRAQGLGLILAHIFQRDSPDFGAEGAG